MLSQGQSITVDLPTIKQKVIDLVEERVLATNTGSRSFLTKDNLSYQEDLLPRMCGRLLIFASQAQRFYMPENSIFHVAQLDFVHVLVNGKSQERFVRLSAIKE